MTGGQELRDSTNKIFLTVQQLIDEQKEPRTVFLAMLLASSDIFLRCYQHPSEPEFLDMCRSVYAEYVNLPRKPAAGTQAS